MHGLQSDTILSSAATAGDKNERRRNQRADKAASVAALLQHAISDDRFAVAVQELETSFGAKFSEFITGLHAWVCTSARCSCSPPPVHAKPLCIRCQQWPCIECAPANHTCAWHVLLACLFWVRPLHCRSFQSGNGAACESGDPSTGMNNKASSCASEAKPKTRLNGVHLPTCRASRHAPGCTK